MANSPSGISSGCKKAPMGPLGLIRRLLPFLRPYWGRCLLLFAAALVQVSFAMYMAFFYKYMIDRVIGGHDGAFLVRLVGLTAMFLVIVALSEAFQGYLSTDLGSRVTGDIRRTLYDHLQALPMGFYSRVQVGDLVSRYTNDLGTIARIVSLTSYRIFHNLISGCVSAVLLFVMEPRLALLTVGVLPLALLGPRALSARANRAGYEHKRDESSLFSFLQENLFAQKVIRSFGLGRSMADRFEAEQDRWHRGNVRVGVLSTYAYKVSSFSVLLIQVTAISVGAYLCLKGHLTGGTLVGFVGLLGSLGDSGKSLAQNIPDLVQSAAGMEHIDELLEEPLERHDGRTPQPAPRLSNEIRFENVTFSYTGGEINLDDVSFTIPAGKSVAFVGRSGSGKSTVLNLLTRFYQSSGGAIRIDGHDLSQTGLDSLREQIGTVFQDTFLFHDTIRENIRQGRLDATDEEVEEAARTAEIHEFIAGLPEGYDTVVSQTGGRLSGGQRQRIALARALLRKPSILVLDEATSALDPATEHAVNATLEQLRERHTLISVTHRLASAVGMDRIFVMDKGRIVEQGTHEELMAREGIYHELWQKQHGFIVSGEGRHARVQGARLRGIPLFQEADEALLEPLARRFVSEAVEAGKTVIREGEIGDKFYLIVRGKVEVVTTGPNGEELALAILQDGDYFGEIALLEDVPRTATIRTLSQSLFLTLTRPEFEHLLEDMPALREGFDRVVRQRREARARIRGGG